VNGVIGEFGLIAKMDIKLEPKHVNVKIPLLLPNIVGLTEIMMIVIMLRNKLIRELVVYGANGLNIANVLNLVMAA
jgi:hypothetical protein